MIEAKVIADSISTKGHRLTTIEVNFQRFILAEFNTHRVFSRNSASSRAIPIRKQINKILSNPAMPVEFGSNQPGMSAGAPIGKTAEFFARKVWRLGSVLAVIISWTLMKLGVHKQVSNRVLEPYMWHRVIVTSTEWDNFLALRDHPAAQPEIQKVAQAIRVALDNSTPTVVSSYSWHLPYISEEEKNTLPVNQLIRISAARCARVSYLTHDGVRSIEADINLFNRLTSNRPMHSSPLEHVAQPHSGESLGNFTGWRQFRHSYEKNGDMFSLVAGDK